MTDPASHSPAPHALADVSEAARPSIDFLDYWKAGARELKTYRGHTHGVWTAVLSPDQTVLVSAGVDRLVRMWDVETGRLLRSLRGHTQDIRVALFTPD